jgi:sn-glycerol 3-phosphate transport system substrate-binding protein
VPLTTASPSWIHFEMFSAIHDIRFASGGDGFIGLNIELRINSAAHVKHLQRLLDLHKDGLFKLNGRDRDGEKNAQAALDSAVTRGDRVLRDFERTAKQ